MDIRVDGYRSTNDAWSYAHHLPADELPPLSEEQQAAAKKLGLSPPDFARSLVATEMTRDQLAERAGTVGRLVSSWLIRHDFHLRVVGVWLKTFEGKYRVDLDAGGRRKLVFIEEELVDDLLDGGRPEAEERFQRVLSCNLTEFKAAIAS